MSGSPLTPTDGVTARNTFPGTRASARRLSGPSSAAEISRGAWSVMYTPLRPSSARHSGPHFGRTGWFGAPGTGAGCYDCSYA